MFKVPTQGTALCVNFLPLLPPPPTLRLNIDRCITKWKDRKLSRGRWVQIWDTIFRNQNWTIESFSIKCRKTNIKVITEANRNKHKLPNDQSELEVNTCNRRQAREDTAHKTNRDQVAIGFDFTSDALKSGARFLNQSQSDVKRNQSKTRITFDTQLKTTPYKKIPTYDHFVMTVMYRTRTLLWQNSSQNDGVPLYNKIFGVPSALEVSLVCSRLAKAWLDQLEIYEVRL